MHVGTTRSIGKNGKIQHLTTASAFPCVKRADKIIEFLSKHAAFAAWTLHSIPPHGKIAVESVPEECLHHVCQFQQRIGATIVALSNYFYISTS
jgi:hypothetical protein